MTRGGRPSRRGANGITWRGQSVPQEWAQARRLEELQSYGRVKATVNARTNGICYLPECTRPIGGYPHAIPLHRDGVHHPINRAGVCAEHLQAMRGGRDRYGDIRDRLRHILMAYYLARGITPKRWFEMATGQIPIPGGGTHAVAQQGGTQHPGAGRPTGRQ